MFSHVVALENIEFWKIFNSIAYGVRFSFISVYLDIKELKYV